MSVTSVLPGLPPSYGPLSGNASQSAKIAALARQLQQNATANVNATQVTSIRVDGATQDTAAIKAGNGVMEAGYADPTKVSQFQNALAEALRADGAIAGRSASGNSVSGGIRSSIGTSLYKRIGQMGNNDPSTSALLRSWNSIMQTGQDAGSAGVSTLQTFSQHEVPAFESSTFHLTA